MSFVSKDKDFEIEYIFLFNTLYEKDKTFDLLISYCNVEEKQLLEFVIGFMEYKWQQRTLKALWKISITSTCMSDMLFINM